MLLDDLAALPGRIIALAGEVRRIRLTIEPQHESVQSIEASVRHMERELTELHGIVLRIEKAMLDAVEKLPDADGRGPLARAREALAGD